jgi:hypothetical protein
VLRHRSLALLSPIALVLLAACGGDDGAAVATTTTVEVDAATLALLKAGFAEMGGITDAEAGCLVAEAGDDLGARFVEMGATAATDPEVMRAFFSCAPASLVDQTATEIVGEGVVTDQADATCIAREFFMFVGGNDAAFDAAMNGTEVSAMDEALRDEFASQASDACGIDAATVTAAMDA